MTQQSAFYPGNFWGKTPRTSGLPPPKKFWPVL